MSDENTLQAYQVVMPRLGLTMTEAKILEWLVPDGAWVDKGTPLFTIENEKSTLEIEAPASGYLQIQAPVGSVVPILKPVALLKTTQKVASFHRTPVEATSPSEEAGRIRVQAAPVQSAAEEKETSGQIRATPKARQEARKLGIDLTGVRGSGVRGMVVFEDIKEILHKQTVRATPVARRLAEASGVSLQHVSGSGPRGMVTRQDIERVGTSATVSASMSSSTVRPLSGLRAIIADRLSAGWRERPQVTLTTDADATFLVATRRQLNAELALRHGDKAPKVSFNAMLVFLAARALQEFPYMNVQLTPEGIQTMPEINIGVAVDTERGLLVPVVRNATSKRLLEINADLAALVERALSGRSLPDDLTGGVFSITNLGMFDIDAFTPIINPPECAIMGVGRIVSRPVGVEGQIVLREMMALSLSFDHRLVDGAPAAKFLQRIKQLIERPMVIAWLDE
ncbi:MAG: 2-oxo acid dehydrogenase subunit E2 [Anaerolineae bacterium]|nr:2-oxo acid dehydrogenase subunit E2 [Anaerolineae bacterium]